MTSLKDSNLPSHSSLGWPKHLTTPKELIRAIKDKTRLRIVRSPIYSKLVLQFIGSWSYLLAHGLNKSRVFNLETFNKELRSIEENLAATGRDEPQNQVTGERARIRAPLITLSNHISCIDDPVLWASILPLTYYATNTDSVRWSAAAVDICFSKPWHSAFFSLGKTFPIIRGAGLHQPAMEFASALLEHNQWLHLFPEGRVMRDDKQQVISNKDRGYTFKWGISKLILDYFKNTDRHMNSEKHLKILPFYHLGMDKILPIGWPYIPRFGHHITVFIRPTVIKMDMKLLNDILADRKLSRNSLSLKSRTDDEINRIKLTEFLEEEVEKLSHPATGLHNKS